MAMTPKQRECYEWIRKAGRGRPGRWVKHVPVETNLRTLNSLIERGLVERKTVEIPKSKWPKAKRLSGYYHVYFRAVLKVEE